MTPIDIILFCPACGHQHVDAPEAEAHWTNPPHRSHLCARCGHIWRPADVPTNGVASISTKGESDSQVLRPATIPLTGARDPFIAGKIEGYSAGVVDGWDSKVNFIQRLLGDAFVEPDTIRQHREAVNRRAEARRNPTT